MHIIYSEKLKYSFNFFNLIKSISQEYNSTYTEKRQFLPAKKERGV